MSTTFNKDDPSDVGLLELWEERAAIRQYDGEADRETAEKKAAEDLRNMFGHVPKWLVDMIVQKY